jgi:Zn-dependent protease
MIGLFDDPLGFLSRLILQIPALLVAVTVHEVAHAVVADHLGDPTPRRLGRITLNPLPHIDPLGAIAFVLAGFGWAKPVPVNGQNLRHPVRDMAWVAAAGPLSNFLVAFVALVLVRALGRSEIGPAFVADPLSGVLFWTYAFNLALGIFNLIPLPPLDGSAVLTGVLPARLQIIPQTLQRYGLLVFFVLLISGAFRYLMRPAFELTKLWAGALMQLVVGA